MAYSTNTQGQTLDPSSGQPLSNGFYGNSAPTWGSGRIGMIGNGGAGNAQIIGGQVYQPYTPAWYQAMRNYNTSASGAAGQAAGAYTQGAISQIPSLNGLLTGGANTVGSLGGGTGTGSTAGGTGTSGGIIGTGTGASTGSGAGGNYVAPIQIPDQSQAIAAQFGAAKDTVGQNARAALDSLRGEMGATGQLGGGAEATGTQNVITSGEGQLGDVARNAATTQAQLGTQVAGQNAQLGVTQRGQDVQAQQAQAQLALENRQQLFSLLGLAMKGLGGSGGATGGSVSAPTQQLY